MNIIIPIAGGAPSQPQQSTQYIRGLQEIRRKTILQYVMETLQNVPADSCNVIIRRRDAVTYHLDNIIQLLRPGARVVYAEGDTMGAACSCMLAIDHVDPEEPLLIANGDQVLTVDPQIILQSFVERGLDGGAAIFDDIHPRWSYVKLDENDLVIEAAEKRPLSRNAVAGLYYYRKARFFFEAAQDMIAKGAHVNGKYYVCPVFNEMILRNLRIGVYRIRKDQFYHLGHDSGVEAYEEYLENH